MKNVVPASRRSLWPALSYPLLSLVLLVVAIGAAPVPASGLALGLNALALLVALVVSTAAHEAAHALAGRAVGLCVIHVYLGRGPSVWERTLGSARLVVQAVPFTGATMVVAPSSRWLRVRLMAFYAAGPLANALLLAASVLLLADGESFGDFALRPMPLFAFLLVNGLLVFFNALPSPPRTRRGVTTLGTDGWNLLTLPFRDDAKLSPLVIAYAVWEAARLTARGKVAEASVLVGQALKQDPASRVAWVAHTDLLVAMRRWPEAAVRLRLLLDDPEARRAFPDAMPLLANNLAWSDYMEGDPALLDEADRRSKEALAALPDNPLLHGTRGAVLLARGEFEEAEERLTFALERNEPRNKALNACCLAMLHAQGGKRAEAEAWLAKARALSPQCSLLARAEASLAGETVTATASSSPPAAPRTT